MRSDIENTWFVVMESEDDVKDTVLDLNSKRRTFRNERVKVRVKTETSVRSFYTVPTIPVAPLAFQSYPVYPSMPLDPFAYSYGPTSVDTTIASTVDQTSPVSNNNRNNKSNNSENKDKDRKSSRNSNNNNGRERSDRNGNDRSERRSGSDRNRSDRNNNSSSTSTSTTKETQEKVIPIQIDSINFPPLQQTIDASIDTPIPTLGYKSTDNVVKYTHDDILNIVKNINEATLPEGIIPVSFFLIYNY